MDRLTPEQRREVAKEAIELAKELGLFKRLGQALKRLFTRRRRRKG